MAISENLKKIMHNGELISNTFIGGYPVYYISKQGDCYCSKCANSIIRKESPWEVDPEDLVNYDLNYEDTELYCNKCSEKIDCAYEE